VSTASSSGNIYFASDFHLGAPNHEQSLIREKRVVRWLDSIQADCKELYLLGDIFDFWFEYKKVVPRGFIRLFGKLASFHDAGIPIHFFKGNHDLWTRDYLEKELGFQVYSNPIERKIGNKKFYIGHGDGLGPGDGFYKILRKVFHNPLAKWAYRQIHPDMGIRLANFWSKSSRNSQEEAIMESPEKEWLYQYAQEKLKVQHYDYFVFGHRHLPLNLELNNQSKYINLGDWISNFSYAKFDGEKLELLFFENT